jgi:5-methylcytosine-specific restriction endonuclease McrA
VVRRRWRHHTRNGRHFPPWVCLLSSCLGDSTQGEPLSTTVDNRSGTLPIPAQRASGSHLHAAEQRDEVAERMPAFAWAFREAPTRTTYELAILSWVASNTIDGAGYGACLTARQIADRFHVSERTVRRVVAELAMRGLLAPGDQRLIDHLPPGHRPAVWDVPFPGRGLRPTFIRTLPAWQGSPTDAAIAARMSMWPGCWICGGPKQAVDHVKPRSRGGADLLCNYRPICTRCNSRKNNRWRGAIWAHALAGTGMAGGIA